MYLKRDVSQSSHYTCASPMMKKLPNREENDSCRVEEVPTMRNKEDHSEIPMKFIHSVCTDQRFSLEISKKADFTCNN